MYEIKEDSIQKWAEEAEKIFASNHKKEMTDDEAKYLIMCQSGEETMENDEGLKEKLQKNEFGYCSVFYNRVKLCHTYECSIAACVFIGLMANSFGEVTIYANYLQYMAFKHNKKRIDVRFLCWFVFPYGFPTKDALRKVWDLQKLERNDVYDSDNLLDYNICQKTISFDKN